MFTVRGIHRQTGEVRKISADEVTPATRQSMADLWNYTCHDTACGATLHWRKSHRADGNTKVLRETFATNKSTPHRLGCSYDYSAFADEHRDIVYLQDERIHIRVNFPLGGFKQDISPTAPQVSDHFNRAAHPHAPTVKKLPIPSLRELTDFIEKHFESLESPALADIDLTYQDRVFRWDDMFIKSDHYSSLYRAAYHHPVNEEADPVMVVVKPLRRMTMNSNAGLPRFVCEAQYAKPENRSIQVEPVIICSQDIAPHLEKVARAGSALLIAARPYPAQRHMDLNKPPVYLLARSVGQLARVDADAYWRLVSGPKHQIDFLQQMPPTPL